MERFVCFSPWFHVFIAIYNCKDSLSQSFSHVKIEEFFSTYAVIVHYKNSQLKCPVCLKSFHKYHDAVRGMPAYNIREVLADGLPGIFLYFVF